MWPSIMSAWPAHCDLFEGRLGFMYLDSLGLVTTGRGNLIDPAGLALGLPWLKKGSGTMANTQEIIAEWNRVKAHQEMAPRGGGAFGSITTLFLSDPSINALTFHKLESNEAELSAGLLRGVWAGLRADAQLASHSMAWAMGAGFPAKYPRWTACMIAGDLAGAAAECRITHPINASITARNDLNERGFILAAEGANAGWNPAVCWSLVEAGLVAIPPASGGAS